jgi:predicted metal-dependent hydrolase
VPRRFVEYVVFHEMLHAVVPGEFCAGKRLYHTSNFRAFEKAFPDLDDMYQLAEKLLHVLC